MPADRPATLFERLSKTDLLEQAQLEELSTLPEAGNTDPRALGNVLLKRKLLTRYQINQIAQGRGGDLRIGNYLLLDKLGEGGMGQVFRARHQHMQRVVALKLIRKEKLASEEAVKRFYQEVAAAGQLHHPNIVVAYDAGPAGSTHYFSMEFVAGVDLSKLIGESGPLPPGLACEYVRQAATGLQHAHERGLVHRDIKPANLLVTQDNNGAPLVKVLDMGLARTQTAGGSQNDLTKTGQVMGTPDYLAPEQALDARSVDARSDLYSLGCTLYYLLTGHPPFQGETLTQVLLKHQMAELEIPSTEASSVPAGIWKVVRKLMAKQPAERYQNAGEVMQALAPWCDVNAVPGERRKGGAREAAGGDSVWGTLVGDENGEAARRLRKKSGESTERLQVSVEPVEPARSNRMLFLIAGGVGFGVLLMLGLVLAVALRSGEEKTPRDAAATLPVKGADVGPVKSTAPPASGAALAGATREAVAAKTAEERSTKDPPADPPVAKGNTDPESPSPGASNDSNKSSSPSSGNDSSTGPGTSPSGAKPSTTVAVTEPTPAPTVPFVPTTPVNTNPPGRARSNRPLRISDSNIRIGPIPRDDVPVTKQFKYIYRYNLANGAIRVAITPDGHYGWFSRSFNECGFVELPSGKLRPLLADRNFRINTQGFSPEGRRALTSSTDQTLRLWDLHTGQQIRVFHDSEHNVKDIVFSPDGRFVATARGNIRVADGKLQYIDSGIHLWSTETGRIVHSWDRTDQMPDQLAFSKSGDRLYTVDHMKARMTVFNTKTGEELGPLTIVRPPSQTLSAHLGNEGAWLLTAGSNGTAYVWDAESGLGPMRLIHPGEVKRVDWGPGHHALTAGMSATYDKPDTFSLEVRVWNGETGELLRRFTGEAKTIVSMAVSADGKRLLVGDNEGSARLFYAGQ